MASSPSTPGSKDEVDIRDLHSVRSPKTREHGAVPQSKQQLSPSDEYNFTHESRGTAIIINNRDFDYKRTGQYNRDGTDEDAAALESLFVAMGFDVTRHDNLTPTDMSIILAKASSADYTNADCFVCAILSHGERDYIYGTTGKIKIDGLVDYFKGDRCQSLAGKPKIFFLQACRGKKYDWGVETSDGAASSTDMTDALSCINPSVRTIPIEADLMIAYSVAPGFFSWRNNVDGSWFIQAIVRVFREHSDTMELTHMLTLVNKCVAFEFASCTDDAFTTDMKQVPCFVSTLTKFIYFRPKY